VVHWNQVVRSPGEETDFPAFQVKLRAIAITPRLATDDPDRFRRSQFPHPLQHFAKDRLLLRKLVFIRRMLIMAATACTKVWASRFDARHGTFLEFHNPGSQ